VLPRLTARTALYFWEKAPLVWFVTGASAFCWEKKREEKRGHEPDQVAHFIRPRGVRSCHPSCTTIEAGNKGKGKGGRTRRSARLLPVSTWAPRGGFIIARKRCARALRKRGRKRKKKKKKKKKERRSRRSRRLSSGAP